MSPSAKKPPQLYPDREKDDLSGHFHRQLIGNVGLLLPALLWLIAAWRPTAADQIRWVPLSSVSAYYYSGAVSAFSGLLVALALFLFAYRGYDNKYYRRDRIAAWIAGLAALLVALFPTAAPSEPLTLFWWTKPIGVIHFAAATVLFGSFIYFSLFQFPMARRRKSTPLSRAKRARNVIYISSGLAMVACITWAVIAQVRGQSIFWPEVLALEFFAISWLVKGRAYSTVAAAGKRAVYYARDPRQLVKDISKAVSVPEGAAQKSSRADS